MNQNTYTTIVGMEIHVELKTNSKMFCGCKNDPFHAPQPNIYTCPVCLGMPGGLPVPNKKAIEWTILLGLALGCDIPLFSKFDRKNYFYPDLAKGYQISQYDQPFCVNGLLKTTLGDVRIRRVHLEEDTGKLQHKTIDGKKVSLIDFNRSGVPLVEIVTEADIRSGEHAKLFLKSLHQIIRYLNISDADMEKGSMRLEPNISVLQHTNEKTSSIYLDDKDLPPYKVEVKNINSFNFVKKAIEFETERHIEIIRQGKIPVQETRGWNEDKNCTFSQRVKEEADDYRYFPEPDIPPIHWTEKNITDISTQLPALPEDVIEQLQDSYQLPYAQSNAIADTAELANYFEEVVAAIQKKDAKKEIAVIALTVANWLINKKIDWNTIPANDVAETIFAATQEVPVDNAHIDQVIAKVFLEQEKAVTDYRSGKEAVFGFLLGQVIKELHGKGEKQVIITVLKKTLQAI